MVCRGVLYFVGIGLSSRHITREAEHALREADVIFLDTYTSFYEDDPYVLIKAMNNNATILKASRSDLEEHAVDKVLRKVLEGLRVAIVSIGDPFIATTHNALRADAAKLGCRSRYVPGINVYSYAISVTGLFNYKFGASATIVYPHEPGGEPPSHPYEVLGVNKKAGYHTFFFLDISPDRGPMKPNEAVSILLYLEEKYSKGFIDTEERLLILEKLGHSGERVHLLSAHRVVGRKWNNPPYSIIVPGQLNPVEKEVIEVLWRGDRE